MKSRNPFYFILRLIILVDNLMDSSAGDCHESLDYARDKLRREGRNDNYGHHTMKLHQEFISVDELRSVGVKK